MSMKNHLLTALREQLGQWETFLAGLSTSLITAPAFDLDWSVQDVVSHLWAWQQVSLARLQAAAGNHKPSYPAWLLDLPGDWEASADVTNAWIHRNFHSQTWAETYQAWHEGYASLITTAGQLSEGQLLDGDRYPWMKGYSIADVLLASYAHHQEHLEKLSFWLKTSQV